MSGGKFDYIQYRMDQAADEVKSYIRSCESPSEHEYTPEYTAETMAKFLLCEQTIRRAAAMLQRMDWLVSGDDGEDSFHKRWAKEVSDE